MMPIFLALQPWHCVGSGTLVLAPALSPFGRSLFCTLDRVVDLSSYTYEAMRCKALRAAPRGGTRTVSFATLKCGQAPLSMVTETRRHGRGTRSVLQLRERRHIHHARE